VYDMYHWHRIDTGTDDSVRRGTGATASTAHRGAAPHHADGIASANGGDPAAGPAAQAVQVALDLRDNGGDRAADRGE
jgi:hypothetical protein